MTPVEIFNAPREQAQFVARLVNAYSSALSVVEQLTPVLDSMGLLKPNGGLNTDRVLAIQKRARGKDDDPNPGNVA